jgi:hypothetical protein
MRLNCLDLVSICGIMLSPVREGIKKILEWVSHEETTA